MSREYRGAAPAMQSYEKQTVPVHNYHDDHVEGDQQTYLRVVVLHNAILIVEAISPSDGRQCSNPYMMMASNCSQFAR
jgi:hypothetical protein